MLKRDEFGFPSFWQLQMMGWVGLYLLAVVGSIPDFLKRPTALRDTTVAALFMFLATFALRPILPIIAPSFASLAGIRDASARVVDVIGNRRRGRS
jgi:hypothetical protein